MNARVTGDPEAPRKINPALSPALEEVILHALERDPRQRYQTAAQMKGELEDLGSVELTHRDQRLRAPQPWKGRRHTAVLICALVLSWVALFFAVFFILSHKRH
jgi:serine/threonine protein kinase